MKIAISNDSGKVAEHFGRCPQFTILEIEKGKVIKKEVIENPGHFTGFLPKFFHEKGISIMVVGGVGRKAQKLFEEYEIKLIWGVSGNIKTVLKDFIEGKIKTEKNICLPGNGKGYGIKKEDKHE